MFFDRRRELEALSRVLPDSGAALFVLYGRRRVGKTELLSHFLAGRRHAYFTGDLGTPAQHVRRLSQLLGDVWEDPFLRAGRLEDWFSLIEYLLGRRDPLTLVLDEFPFLCQAEPALPSLLQRLWDQHWRHQNVQLVLCGSSVRFMEDQVLAEPSPLFGRRTAQLRLGPMDWWGAREFFPDYSPVQSLESYALVGGVPAYLARLDPGAGLEANLGRLLDPTGYLFAEPRLLLLQEFQEPRHYFAILAAVAAGRTRLNDIAQDTGLSGSFVSRYLDTLTRLELIEREVPATEKNPARSRRGLYRLRDPFFRFWFRFVMPHQAELERHGPERVVTQEILPHLSHFVAPVFETVCQDWLLRERPFPFVPRRVGRWWEGAEELDLVAFDDHSVVFGECKWTQKPMGQADLERLHERARLLTALSGHRAYYALFCRGGFRGLKPRADLILVDVADM